MCNDHLTVSFILLWFQASLQPSLRFCVRADLTSKHVRSRTVYQLEVTRIPNYDSGHGDAFIHVSARNVCQD